MALKRARQAGFTLIEILVVMAIIIAIASLSTVAITSMGKSTGLSAAGSKMASAINLARQNAMGKYAMTALIIPSDHSVDNAYQAYIIYELPTKEDGSTPTAEDWRAASKWEALPKGVIISRTDGSTGSKMTSYTENPPVPFNSSKLVYQGQLVKAYEYILFLPNGSVAKPTAPNPAKIRLVEGAWPQDTASPVYTRLDSSGNILNYFDISIVSATGTIKIDRP